MTYVKITGYIDVPDEHVTNDRNVVSYDGMEEIDAVLVGDMVCVNVERKTFRRLRLSRPCYDKMHRCPGWAGGGWRFARVDRCPNKTGSLVEMYEKRAWRWRFNRHAECGVIVMPYVVRWLDWRHWRWIAHRVVARFDGSY